MGLLGPGYAREGLPAGALGPLVRGVGRWATGRVAFAVVRDFSQGRAASVRGFGFSRGCLTRAGAEGPFGQGRGDGPPAGQDPVYDGGVWRGLRACHMRLSSLSIT